MAAPLQDVDAHISANQHSVSDAADDPLLFLGWTPHTMAVEIANMVVGGTCEEVDGAFPCPSWTSFWRRWDRYTAFLHKGSGTPQDKREAAREWRLHLSGQYHDRLIYDHVRWFSWLRVHLVLCTMVGSLDKAKGAVATVAAVHAQVPGSIDSATFGCHVRVGSRFQL